MVNIFFFYYLDPIICLNLQDESLFVGGMNDVLTLLDPSNLTVTQNKSNK